MQNFVFVLDTHKVPLSPCQPSVARKLLRDGKAAVYRRFPFTVILKRATENAIVEPVQLKIDPGSKTTGMALVQNGKVIFAAELTHRSFQIREALESRRALRRGRRNRKTRYRKPKFRDAQEKTTGRPKGWLSPSLKSRVANLQSWFVKFFRVCNLGSISMEFVRFDTQKVQNPEISGVEYQQGTLMEFEVKEYLLEKFGRKCCYCGATNVPLEIEHIVPKSRGGSNRVSNLVLACVPCNQEKNNQTAKELGFPDIQARAGESFKDAAAVNTVRWATFGMLKATGLPVETGTGGQTKFNRHNQDYPKAHWIDAACVGESGSTVRLDLRHQPLLIKAMGRGSRQMCRVDKFGFPRTSAKANKRVHGFQTGDIVKAIVTEGKKKGTYHGRVAVRSKGSFNIKTSAGTTEGIGWKYCKLVSKVDGYDYTFPASTLAPIPPTSKEVGFSEVRS